MAGQILRFDILIQVAGRALRDQPNLAPISYSPFLALVLTYFATGKQNMEHAC